MPVYITMLRGINVTGHNKVKMDELKGLFESLGLENVRTYIQSGNVVFDGAKATAKKISRDIEKQISQELGLSVSVVTKTKAELGKIIKSNPFIQNEKVDLSKLHVTFLSGKPSKAAFEKAGEVNSGADEFAAIGKEVYVHCPHGYGRAKLSNNYFEKILDVAATTRNWKTVNKLFEMAEEA